MDCSIITNWFWVSLEQVTQENDRKIASFQKLNVLDNSSDGIWISWNVDDGPGTD